MSNRKKQNRMRNVYWTSVSDNSLCAKTKIWQLFILCLLSAVSVSAQQIGQNQKISAQIKIESFDWYAESEILNPPELRNHCRDCSPVARFKLQTENLPPPSENFIYRIRVRNLSRQTIETIVWAYDFFNPLTKERMASHEFVSRERIKPRKRKTLYAVSSAPPTPIVDANLLAANEPYLESATIKSLIFSVKINKTGRLRQKKKQK
jgi:hypothetical protein